MAVRDRHRSTEDEAYFAAWREVHGPPDHVVSAHLQQLEATPTRRRWTKRWGRNGVLAAMAASVVVVLGRSLWDRWLVEEESENGSSSVVAYVAAEQRADEAKLRESEGIGHGHPPSFPHQDPPAPAATTHTAPGTRTAGPPTRGRSAPVIRSTRDGNRTDELRPDDRLKTEVRLLASARASLQAGDPIRALALLQQHAARFPDSPLTEERAAWTAVATCARHPRGHAEIAAAFTARYPHSLQRDRVLRACYGSAKRRPLSTPERLPIKGPP